LKITRESEVFQLSDDAEFILLTEDVVNLKIPKRELTFKDERNVENLLEVHANRFISEQNVSLGKGLVGSVASAINSMKPFTSHALKIFDMSDKQTSRENTVSYLREIEMLEKIQHPNIIRLFEKIEYSSKTIMVLDLMDSDLVKNLAEKTYTESVARDAIKQILQGL
jgi:serine/threonine protein kinase